MEFFEKDFWIEINQSISKNRTRTLLTMLGVVIGIYIYILLSGMSQALNQGFEIQFESVSPNSIFITGGITSKPYSGYGVGRHIKLSLNDVDLIKRMPEVLVAVPKNVRGHFGTSPGFIKNGKKSGNYAVYGDYPDFTKIYPKVIFDGGRFINEMDINKKRAVCVIGERTKKELFEKKENPIGKYVNIDGLNFKVIGVHKLVNTGNQYDSDSDVFIPFTTYARKYNTGESVTWLILSSLKNVDVVALEEKIIQRLKNSHNVHPNDLKAFDSINLGKTYRKAKGFAKGILFLSLIVGFSTVVSGIIGIGNILLISINERKNEIGIKRALGATAAAIRNQIILEAITLILTAGFFGIVFGLITLKIIGVLIEGGELPIGTPTIDLIQIISVLLTMVIFGILIGLIPAQRAIRIKPIEAIQDV